MKFLKVIFVGLVCFTQVNCAGDFTGNLETASFQLDAGNYEAAIDAANAALAAEPGNVQATRILASAYFGRSGLNFLDIYQGLLTLDEDTATNFSQIADVLPDPDTVSVDLADVRSAIEALDGLSGIDAATISDETLADAAFDLGIMQMIEHFALGVYGSDFLEGNNNDLVDVAGIVDSQRASVQDDLVKFDDRLIAAGTDSTESFLQEVRQTFCILEPISATEGFTLAEYQAFVGCQLSNTPDSFDTTAFSADIANCAQLEPNDSDPCISTNTSL